MTTVRAVRKGERTSLPSTSGYGSSRREAPEDCLVITSANGREAVVVTRAELVAELRRVRWLPAAAQGGRRKKPWRKNKRTKVRR